MPLRVACFSFALITSYGQIVFQFVGNCLVKNACQHFAEQSGDHKDQNHDEYSRCEIEKETAGCDHRDKKAVNTHFLQTHYIFPDETVIVQHGAEHFAELLED